ncbi:MAG: transposase [Rhodospirillaceae bacterium]|nr:transposase [Rhodospirillales bacterium]
MNHGARLTRCDIPGHPQHVIQRGNSRCAIFVEAGDYEFYPDCLEDAAKRFGCDIHAYALMTNHVHLLVTQQASRGGRPKEATVNLTLQVLKW